MSFTKKQQKILGKSSKICVMVLPDNAKFVKDTTTLDSQIQRELAYFLPGYKIEGYISDGYFYISDGIHSNDFFSYRFFDIKDAITMNNVSDNTLVRPKYVKTLDLIFLDGKNELNQYLDNYKFLLKKENIFHGPKNAKILSKHFFARIIQQLFNT